MFVQYDDADSDDDVTDRQTNRTLKTTQNHALLHVQRLQSTIYFDWTMLIKKNNKKYRKKTILCLVLSLLRTVYSPQRFAHVSVWCM